MGTISEHLGSIGDAPKRPALSLTAFTGLLDRLLQRMEMRRELRQLSEFDDRMLKDVGISRADIAHAQRDLLWRR